MLVKGEALDNALGRLAPRQRSAADAALCAELAYGVIRWLPQLEAVLDARIRKPLKRRDADVRHALLLGLYQLLHARTPDHAAVNETVALIKARWARGLVNAVLRGVAKGPDAARAEALGASAAARLAHPQWLLDAFDNSWPDEVETIAAAGNARPPMTLRVNRRRGTREDYLARLSATGIEARPHPVADTAITLAAPCGVTELPGWDDGDVSVQDAAAQLCATLLELAPGQRFLDACAAPGGKCAHAMELQPMLAAAVALDVSERRLARAAETFARLGLAPAVMTADAGDTDRWYDGQPFDRILVDAPCSGTGVIRRHPDIKALRRASDLESLAARQGELLDGVLPTLGRGGRLLYVTCSVLREENDDVMAAFAERHDEVRIVEVPLVSPGARRTLHGQQLLPSAADAVDGFYYAVVTHA